LREGAEQALALAEFFDAEFAEIAVFELVEDGISDALFLEFRSEVLEVLGFQDGFQFIFHDPKMMGRWAEERGVMTPVRLQNLAAGEAGDHLGVESMLGLLDAGVEGFCRVAGEHGHLALRDDFAGVHAAIHEMHGAAGFFDTR